MDTQIDLQISDLDNVSHGKLIKFVGDLDATNVESTLDQVTKLIKDGFVNIVADGDVHLQDASKVNDDTKATDDANEQ